MSKYGIQCIYHPANVLSENEIDNMIDTGLKRFEKIDILVNNAGTGNSGTFWELSKEDFMNTININLTAPFLFMKKLTPSMMKNKWEE